MRLRDGVVAVTRRRWVIMVDGAPLDDLQGRPLYHVARVAVFGARDLSTGTARPVACAVLGDARSLRRFEAGREVEP